MLDVAAALGATTVVESEEQDRPLRLKLLAETPGLPTFNPDKRIHYVSPTHIDAHDRCPKRHYGAKVLGIEQVSSSDGARVGSLVHKRLEGWSRTGKLADTDEHKVIVTAGLAMNGARPRTADGAPTNWVPSFEDVTSGRADIEREFVLYVDGLAVPFYGLIDVFWLCQALIGDYKSTSDFKWMKSEYELRVNSQAVIYSLAGMEAGISAIDDQGREYIDFELYYLRTKGAPQSNRVPVRLYRDKLEATMLELVKKAQDLIESAQLPFKEVRHDTRACGDFGGCFMRDTCHAAGVAVYGESTFDHLLTDFEGSNALIEDETMALPAGLQKMKDAQNAVKVTAAAAPLAPESVGDQAVTPPAAATPAPNKFGTPNAPKAVQVPQSIVAPPPVQIQAPKINPPDGFPANVPGTIDGPTPPAGVVSQLDTNLREQVAGEQAAKAEAKAAKAADKPKLGIPGKKAAAPAPAAETPAAPSFFGCEDEEIAESAKSAPAFQEALSAHLASEKTLTDLIAAKPEVVAKINELLAAGEEDEADELKAKHDMLVTKAERAVTKTKSSLDAAAAEAIAQATEVFAEHRAATAKAAEERAKAQEKVLAAGPPVVAASSAEAVATVRKTIDASGEKVLCINCRSQTEEVTFWEEWVAPFIRRAEKANKVEHFRMIGHDANLKVLLEITTALKAGTVQLPDCLVMLNYSAQTHGTFVETLRPLFNKVYQ